MPSIFRSDKLEASKFEFDRNIMDVYKGNLVADQVALDDTTLENLKHRYIPNKQAFFLWAVT